MSEEHHPRYCKTVDLIGRIRKAPAEISYRDAAVKLIQEGACTPEEAFFAEMGARILNKPSCEVCGGFLTNDEARVGVLCIGCHDEMFGDRGPVAHLGTRPVRMW